MLRAGEPAYKNIHLIPQPSWPLIMLRPFRARRADKNIYVIAQPNWPLIMLRPFRAGALAYKNTCVIAQPSSPLIMLRPFRAGASGTKIAVLSRSQADASHTAFRGIISAFALADLR